MKDKILTILIEANREMPILELWDAMGEPVYAPTLRAMADAGLITFTPGRFHKLEGTACAKKS